MFSKENKLVVVFFHGTVGGSIFRRHASECENMDLKSNQSSNYFEFIAGLKS